MKSVSMFAIAAASIAAGLSSAHAADMSFERALNADREPQNWLLHHQNYQGHRFSALKQIDTGTVADLRLAFTVGLGGLQAGGRYANAYLFHGPAGVGKGTAALAFAYLERHLHPDSRPR